MWRWMARFKRTCAIGRIVAGIDQKLLGLLGQGHLVFAIGQPFAHPFDLDVDNLEQVVAGQAMEGDDLVDAVEKFRLELPMEQVVDLPAHGLGVGLGQLHDDVAAEVGGHDQDRVLKIHRSALAVGHPAVVEHLQQHIEDIRMGLFDLVEQDDRIGPPPHRLGEHAALVIADIAGRSADQSGH